MENMEKNQCSAHGLNTQVGLGSEGSAPKAGGKEMPGSNHPRAVFSLLWKKPHEQTGVCMRAWAA